MKDNVTSGLFLDHVQAMPAMCRSLKTDRLILVTGVPGAGKSGVTHVAMRLMDPKFHPRQQCHWTVPRYVEAELKLPAGRPIKMDELVKAGTSYRYMSGDSTDFADRLYINRELMHPQFVLHPEFGTVSPIIREGRAWEHWRILKRYKNHAVVKVQQLRDEERIFSSPRTLFTATVPKPEGPLWDLEESLKAEFGRSQGMGTLKEEGVFGRVVDDMAKALNVFGNG